MALRINVTNAGGSAAQDVVVALDVPDAITFVNSTPDTDGAEQSRLEWRLGDVNAGQTRSIEANFQIEQAGGFDLCPTARGADGVQARDCARIAVGGQIAAGVPKIEVQVRGPKQAAIGDEVQFEITVANRGDAVAKGLEVTDRFDAGLAHEKWESPIVRDLEDVAPGQSRTIGVTLHVTQAGTLCNEAEVKGPGGLRATSQACVEVVDQPAVAPPLRPGGPRPAPRTGIPPETQPALPTTPDGADDLARPKISVKHKGPPTAFVGGIAEFEIDVTNVGTTPLTNIIIVADYDQSLVAGKASAGHTVDDQLRLTWTYPTLRPGKFTRLKVQCRCQEPPQATGRACGRVSVTCDQKVTDEAEACVRVEVPRTELSVTVNDLRDPVEVGKEMVYEIRVKNLGPAPDRQVTVSFTVPEGMTLVPLGTIGPEKFRRFIEIQAPNYRFEPVAEIRPNETLTWIVRVQTDKPGDVVFKARVDSAGSEQPIEAEQRTKILPRGQ